MLGANFKITPEIEEKEYGKFVIEPLDNGYGHTLGNALRRILLSSLPGAALTSVKISGIKHQFSTIPGLKEDVVELLLNLKKLKVKYFGDGVGKIKLSIKGPKEITGKDFITPPEIEIVNKDHYIGTLADKKSELELEVTVEKGYGYQPSEEKKFDTIGVIPLDSLFTPIVRVNYKVESTRVGRMTNLDKLILEIWTDGSILPQEALKESAKNLVQYFTQVYDPKVILEENIINSNISSEEEENILKLTVEELDLPTRIANCLKNGNIETVRDLMAIPREELSKIKNLGGKSISIIEEKLKEKGKSLKNN